MRNLEKEKHLEDYYKQNPTTSTTSSPSEAPMSEDDEGHGEDENTTVSKGEESGKAVPEEGEDSNEEAQATEGADMQKVWFDSNRCLMI